MYQVEGTFSLSHAQSEACFSNVMARIRIRLFIPRASAGRCLLAESAIGILAISRHGGTETITANDDIGAVKIDKYDLGVFVLFHNR